MASVAKCSLFTVSMQAAAHYSRMSNTFFHPVVRYWLQTYKLKNAGTEKVILGYRIDVYRVGTRGGLGGYSPSSGHASPPSEGENGFFRRFLAFIVP